MNISFFKVKQFALRHWLSLAFVAGFITDLILLNQIDNAFDNAVLLFYVFLATSSLLLFYYAVADQGPTWLVRFLAKTTPITMQYAFGGLLSGMLIFYGRSGDFVASAPFLLLIITVIILNELVKKRSERLLYNLSLYFIGVFSYFVLIVPVWLGQIGDLVFIGSGLIAVALTIFVIKLLKGIVPNFLTMQKRWLVFSIGSLYAIFNAFYFLNIIPPIPLSLTQLSIYHSSERTVSGGYRNVGEQLMWYEKLPYYPLTINPSTGQVACFARVYAPTSLRTSVAHVWEYKDTNGDWQERFTLSYPITGENKGGYGGYTTLLSTTDGVWRCSVENARGQVLGRKTFTIDSNAKVKPLVTVIE